MNREMKLFFVGFSSFTGGATRLSMCTSAKIQRRFSGSPFREDASRIEAHAGNQGQDRKESRRRIVGRLCT